MKASAGDRLHMHSKHVDEVDRYAEVVEVRGREGDPPYLVRFTDGRESLVYPSGDCEVEPPRPRAGD